MKHSQSIKNFSLVLFAGCLLWISLTIINNAGAISNGEEPAVNTIDIPQDELSLIAEVLHQVRNSYVDQVDEQELLIGAIRGILNELDPHSSYLTPENLKRVRTDTEGKFGGLGISVTMEDGLVKVITPIDDTPAKRAGILAGDLIVRLDDTDVRGMTLSEAVDMMRGVPGTSIILTVARKGEARPLIIEIIRETIEVPSVKKRMLEPGFGYARIIRFQQETAPQLSEAIAELIEENGAPLDGLILDMRYNPGGLLGAAVGVSDLLLDEGLIVYTQGRADGAGNAPRKDYRAVPGDILAGVPIVVLVNEGSASAAEIVAGALQDNRRALVVGRPTFGKATVQTLIELENEGALKLTIARYYTPMGTSIQLNGIDPDVVFRKVSNIDLAEAEDDFTVTESNFSNSLDNPNGEQPETDNEDESEAEGAPLVESDFELYESLNLLKGLSVYHR